jgi:hypothetical protein
MENMALWQLMRETWAKIEPCYLPVVEPVISESGLDKREWGMLLAAQTFEPEDTTPGHLMVRGPYTAADQYLLWLSNAAGRGYFETVAEGQFKLSQQGKAITERFIDLARQAMEAADPLQPEDSKPLVRCLDQLIETSLRTPAPPDTWSIRLSYKLMPDRDPTLPYIEQALSCLSAYRDDAHLASWQDSDLSATALEALTLIWRHQAGTLDELVEKLARRGHSREVYADALAELREKDYVSGIRSALKVTERGDEFRRQVESITDLLFFAPWSCLSQGDKEELAVLFTKLEDGLG